MQGRIALDFSEVNGQRKIDHVLKSAAGCSARAGDTRKPRQVHDPIPLLGLTVIRF
jgi:hypothetical protein